jgi:hypothetical protein
MILRSDVTASYSKELVIGKEEKVLKAVRRRISCDFMKGMPKSEH